MTYPASLQVEFERIVRDLETVRGENYRTELTTRLETMKRLWEQQSASPLIQRMSAIVETLVSSYHADFYLFDLQTMERHPSTPFIWAVRDMGTHLIWLEGDAETVRANKDLLQAHLRVWGKERTVYYWVDAQNTLHRTNHPENLPFKVREPVTA